MSLSVIFDLLVGVIGAAIVPFTGCSYTARVVRGTVLIGLAALASHASDAAQEGPIELMLGSRRVVTSKRTAGGTPVVPMWAASKPADAPAAGFPLVAEAEHFDVWRPVTTRDWAFNHFASLIWHRGRFYAMWGNHPIGELGPGQRVLCAWSDDDGRTWSQPFPLFPRPGKVGAPGETPDIHLSPDRWIVAGGRLYAVAYVASGETYPIAREIGADGSLGKPFVLRPPSGQASLPLFMKDLAQARLAPPEATLIQDLYRRNDVVSWWGTFLKEEGLPRRAVDNASMIEPYSYRARDGARVLLLRSMPTAKSDPENNHRLYVSFGTAEGGWSPPYPTDIPDSPSRFQVIVLEDGTTLLIGNQTAPEFDRWTGYLPRDPLTVAVSKDGYTFDRVYAVRAGAPQEYRFQGITRRSLGYGYPSSVVRDGWLYILYSVGKEDMAFTRLPLSALGLKAKRAAPWRDEVTVPTGPAHWSFDEPAGTPLANVSGTSLWSHGADQSAVTTGTGLLHVQPAGNEDVQASAPIAPVGPRRPAWLIAEVEGWRMASNDTAFLRLGFGESAGTNAPSFLCGLRLHQAGGAVYLSGEHTEADSLQTGIGPVQIGGVVTNEHTVFIVEYYPDAGSYFLIYQIGRQTPVRIGPGNVRAGRTAAAITLEMTSVGGSVDIDGLAVVPPPRQKGH